MFPSKFAELVGSQSTPSTEQLLFSVPSTEGGTLTWMAAVTRDSSPSGNTYNLFVAQSCATSGAFISHRANVQPAEEYAGVTIPGVVGDTCAKVQVRNGMLDVAVHIGPMIIRQ